MYTDIHSAAIDPRGEDITDRGTWQANDMPFATRSYGVFAFLAGVRNWSAVTPIKDPRGLPPDANNWRRRDLGDYSHSWLLIDELTAFDYESEMEDRRIYALGNKGDHPRSCPPGHGKVHSLRTFLMDGFFADLAELQRIGADRVVFGFRG